MVLIGAWRTAGQPVTAHLTPMQKRYIWLAGSNPDMILGQGRGVRSGGRLRYAFDDDAGEIVVFGYSNPPWFLVQRGLFRPLQAPHTYTLTEEGEKIFRKLVLDGEGMTINSEIREVKLKRLSAPNAAA